MSNRLMRPILNLPLCGWAAAPAALLLKRRPEPRYEPAEKFMIPEEPMTPPPYPIFYRFRSTKALLGEHRELARQEIYFASKSELNDPLEGYANVVWQGDPILWRNLLRHYLLVLSEMIVHATVTGEEFDESRVALLGFMTDEDLPDAPIRGIYASICKRFLEERLASDWVEGLAQRQAVLSSEELAGYLRIVHLSALDTIVRAFEDQGVSTFLGQFDLTDLRSKSTEELAAWFSTDGLAYDERRVLHSVFENQRHQMDLLDDLATPITPAKRVWMFFLKDFPSSYVRAIEDILHPEWRTACFVADPTHASMWGVYAEGHKGVCLAFKSHPGSDGKPSLRLHGAFGHKADADGFGPYFLDHSLPMVPVLYDSAYPATDFFRSLGRLPRSALERFWYSNAEGTHSPRVLDILAENQAWRDDYWIQAGRIVSTKLPQWGHEGEHRLVAQGDRPTLEERKFRYRLADLDGVIFGIKTTHADKLEIIRTLAIAAARQGKHEPNTIQFSQAAFSRTKGAIEIQSLSLLTSQFPKLIEAYAKMPELAGLEGDHELVDESYSPKSQVIAF